MALRIAIQRIEQALDIRCGYIALAERFCGGFPIEEAVIIFPGVATVCTFRSFLSGHMDSPFHDGTIFEFVS